MHPSQKGPLVAQDVEKAVELLFQLEPKLRYYVDFDLAFIDNIDSSNMTSNHWDMLTRAISNHYEDYDGFVIIQGTDTMAYTSSALSFSLQNLGKPVVLTGSQIPAYKLETDARRNFINAVRVAMMNLSGVFLVFDGYIILGCRATKSSESKLHAFNSVNSKYVGEIRMNIHLDPLVPKRSQLPLHAQEGFNPNVMSLTLTPGTPETLLDQILDTPIEGLILRCFGSGNLPMRYLSSLKKANQKKIPVVISSQCQDGATAMELYEPGKLALELGAIEAYDMSLESAQTKLMWTLANSPSLEAIKTLMHQDFCGEINPNLKKI